MYQIINAHPEHTPAANPINGPWVFGDFSISGISGRSDKISVSVYALDLVVMFVSARRKS